MLEKKARYFGRAPNSRKSPLRDSSQKTTNLQELLWRKLEKLEIFMLKNSYYILHKTGVCVCVCE